MTEADERQRDTEQWLVEVCRELKLPVSGLDDDIFDIGGTSLTVMRLTERIASYSGAALDPEDIFESSTLRGISQTILAKVPGSTVSEPSA